MPDPHEALHEELSDRYELEDVLGEGGMGTVYLARDRKHDRRVAIKTIHAGRTDAEMRRRFEREIGITAQLQHPHILPLLDSGAAGETLYYVMPFVEGESLQSRLARDEKLPVGEAVSIAIEVAQALHHAHEHDVVHRDIKPSNIMLTSGHAVVTDFGIAKAMSEAGGGELTQTGLVIGSPAYMSPEQATGDRPVDGRSDIYSLGCVLYEMLAGEVPFAGSTPLELIAKRVREEAAPLRDRAEGVSAALEEAVKRAMAKAPENRFQTADTFARALSGAPSTSGARMDATSPTTSLTRPMWIRLRDARLLQVSIAYLSASFVILEAADLFTDQLGLPEWVFPGALVILALGLPVLVVAALAQSVGSRGVITRSWRPRITWRRAIGGVVVALAVWGLVVAGYMTMRTLGIGPAAPLIARGLLEERERVILADFANHSADSLLGGAVTEAFRVDLTQSSAIRLLAPDQMRDAMVRMRRDFDGPVGPELARELALREGVKAVVVGEINTIGSAYVISVKLISADSGEELVAYRATAEDRAAIIEAVDGLSKRLRARIGESLASVRQSRPLPSVTTGSLEALELYASAMEMGRRGNRAAAIPILERAVELDSMFAGAYRGLGIYYSSDAGNPGAAQRNIEKAFRFSDRLPEPERLKTRALVHSRRGRLDSAAYYYRLLVEDPRDSALAINNLGDVYERMGRHEEALGLYRRANRAGPNVMGTYVNLASAARSLGLHAVADSALTVMIERFPPSPSRGITDASNAYYAGDIARLEEIVTAWARGPTSDPIGRAAGKQWLASLAGMRGRAELAMALADSATRLYLENGSLSWALSPVVSLVHSAWASNPEAALPYLGPLLREFRDAEALSSAPRFAHGVLGLFASGFALAGELDEARELLASMDSLAALTDFEPTGMAEHARAVVALEEGRPEASLQHLERARAAEYGLLHDYSQLLLGDVKVVLGRLPEAAAEYEISAGTVGLSFEDARTHPPLQPVAHERLGDVYLAMGDTTAALTHLTVFVDMWSDADSELRPRVREAQRKLQEILWQRG